MKQNEKQITVLSCNFKFQLTNEEAYDIVHNKNGKVAKANRKYLNDLLTMAAKKCLEEYDKDKKERKESEKKIEEKN